jgi:hypothetical protein
MHRLLDDLRIFAARSGLTQLSRLLGDRIV